MKTNHQLHRKHAIAHNIRHCTVHHYKIGGGCFNCGFEPPATPAAPVPYFGPGVCITLPNGKVKPVKNLGWLRSNARDVQTITLSPRDDGARCGCILHATLEDGTKYRSFFNDLELCRAWVRRPSLRHATLTDLLP